MKIITKKTKDNPSGVISLGDFADKIGLTNLSIMLDKLKEQAETFLIKEDIIKTIKEILTSTGSLINITNVGSIEKNKNIKPGTIYFNKVKDELRLKMKSGWITLNTK